MDTPLRATVPDQLAKQAQRLVDQGWATDVDSIVAESLRRYLESHEQTLTEQFIRDDLQWGLRGGD